MPKRGSRIQDVTDKRPLKKRRLSSRDEDDMRRIRQAIIRVEEGIQRIEAELQEVNLTLKVLRQEIE